MTSGDVKGEAPFEVDEIFFSRTDERGVIQAGNQVFRRVSGYDWPELIGAPHKIIRHPDMPKAVFHLLWDRLKNGDPIAAYVKNRAIDGRYYWVLAFAMPAEDGFISVRVKPVSELLPTVMNFYQELAAGEAEQGWKPDEDGHKRLLAGLSELGFNSYEEFSAHVVAAEIAARNALTKRPDNNSYRQLLSIGEIVRQLVEDVSGLSEVFQRIRTTPVNMGIMASRIERAGGPISAISGIYSSMSNDIGDWLEGFLRDSSAAFQRMEKSGSDCLTSVAATEIQEEMTSAFQCERDEDCGFSRVEEVSRLTAQSRLIARGARGILASIRNDAVEVQNAVHVLKRHVMSLSSTRVLCEIESAKLTQRSESLEGVVAQLADFQDEIEARHKRIEEGTQAIISALTSGRGAARDEREPAAA